MGLVSEYVRNLVAKQVEDHGVVVWYDPDKHYEHLASNLSLANTTVLRYDGSYFALRHKVEPLIAGLDAPRLVVYLPIDQAKTHHAMVELETAGVVVAPGEHATRNTRLSLAARNALKSVVGEDTAVSIEEQVEAGKLTLDNLDSLAEKGDGIAKGVVSIIFGTSNPQEVALAFLASDQHDADISKKNAAQELAMLLQAGFEVELPVSEEPAAWRVQLSRHVLTTELAAHLKTVFPTKLDAVKIAKKPATRDACVDLARTWRLRRDLRDSYVTQANCTAAQLGVGQIPFDQKKIESIETFIEIELALIALVEAAFLKTPTEDLVHLAVQKQSSFWAAQNPNVQAHWALIEKAGQVLLEAERVETGLTKLADTATAIFKAYAGGNQPWCLLDTYHRHMESRFQKFEFDSGDRHQGLQQLVAKARDRYMEVGADQAEQFMKRLQKAKFPIEGVQRHTEVFEKAVKPHLSEGKTAYVLVDALRFEMARELVEALGSNFNCTINAAVASVPTITEIGMASLLPGANQGAKVVSAGEGKLALEIGGTVVKDRKDRLKLIKANAGVDVFDLKLEDLLPSPGKREREGIQKATLVLLSSQEIDALGEDDNVPNARRMMDVILHDLKRAFRILSELGVKNIVLTADHGFLFGEELGSEMKLDPPGGETIDLHRRVWVGRGGNSDPSYLRAKVSNFGLESDLEIAVPWGFACFKVPGGAKAYFHGGLALQELVIPVVCLTPTKQAKAPAGEITWELKPGSHKISTRFFSVQVQGTATTLLEFTLPKVRVELRAKGQVISQPVSASYGFEEATKDVQLRLAKDQPKLVEPNTITLMIAGESQAKTATVHLLDATSGIELARIEKIEVSISI